MIANGHISISLNEVVLSTWWSDLTEEANRNLSFGYMLVRGPLEVDGRQTETFDSLDARCSVRYPSGTPDQLQHENAC